MAVAPSFSSEELGTKQNALECVGDRLGVMTGHLGWDGLGLLQLPAGSVIPRAELCCGLAQVQKPWPWDMRLPEREWRQRKSPEHTAPSHSSPFVHTPAVYLYLLWTQAQYVPLTLCMSRTRAPLSVSSCAQLDFCSTDFSSLNPQPAHLGTLMTCTTLNVPLSPDAFSHSLHTSLPVHIKARVHISCVHSMLLNP